VIKTTRFHLTLIYLIDFIRSTGMFMCAEPLILGELEDYLTGEFLADTVDERVRQELARFLVEKKHFRKEDIRARCRLAIQVTNNKSAEIKIDFMIQVEGKTGMIVQYGPGSITSRHRPALSVSRLAQAYQIPVVVVTNGEGADILDGVCGEVTGSGLGAIPAKDHLQDIVRKHHFKEIPIRQKVLESRILYAFEVNDSCFCHMAACGSS
jgi:hypothetical protein